MNTSKIVKVVIATLLFVSALVALSKIRQPESKILSRETREAEAKDSFTFADTYNSKFSYKHYSVSWISGFEYIDQDENGDIIKGNAKGGTTEVLMPKSDYTGQSYKVSADLKYILMLTNYKKGWRHSYNGTYEIYDVEAKTFLTTNLGDDIQYVTWSPAGNALAYVKGLNIYYRPNIAAADFAVTADGSFNNIYNGIPDWVYEEEMISSNNVMYFNPTGTYLAFAQFDDTKCKHIQFSRYDEEIYPPMQDVAYPKAGTTQSTNKVFVYSIADDKNTEVQPPAELSKSDYLFNRVTWKDETTFAVSWSNRAQNAGEIKMCEMTPGTSMSCTEDDAYRHESTTGWIYQRRPHWIPMFGGNDEYFTVKPSNGWQHLWKISTTESKVLTQGDYTVTAESASYPSVEYYDPATHYVYFSASKLSPQHRQIYRVNGDSATIEEPQCVTCQVLDDHPDRCKYISTTFSTDATYVIVRCSGDYYPPLYIQYSVDHSATSEGDILGDKQIKEDNAELVATVDETDISTKEYGSFKSITGYNFTYQIFYPPNFDNSGTKKYPLLVDIYAGPGYQRVYPTWSRGWQYRYVPSALDVVVVSIDTRGSLYYGEEFMHEVYRKLGQFEPIDQIEAAKYFAAKDYIDETRVAVWGWSFGGYVTSLVLGNDADNAIKCGFAVAPLTDWRFYDTIYAERYMGLPSADDNLEGYDKASVLPLAKNFRSGAYYLIHGTADDNVHFQNAARLEYELVENDVDFKNFFYADQDHGINQGNANYHVDKVLTRQLCQCFDIPVPDDVWT